MYDKKRVVILNHKKYYEDPHDDGNILFIKKAGFELMDVMMGNRQEKVL